MKKIFKCDCGTHLIEFDYYEQTKQDKTALLGIVIYDIYSPNKGRKYKKPKLTADVVLMDNKYPKELTKFFKFIKGIK